MSISSPFGFPETGPVQFKLYGARPPLTVMVEVPSLEFEQRVTVSEVEEVIGVGGVNTIDSEEVQRFTSVTVTVYVPVGKVAVVV